MRSLNVPQGRAREAAAFIRWLLDGSAIDSLTARLNRISDHPKPTGDVVLESLGPDDVARLRFESTANVDNAEACRTSTAPRIIAHEVDARVKHADLTRAADLLMDLFAGPDGGART